MSVVENPERVGEDVAAREGAAPSIRTDLTILQPTRGWVSLGIRELWQHRELFYFLAWRDIKVRYKQTALGAAWALIQPITTVTIFTILFGHFAVLPSTTPYALLVFSGMLPWMLFTQALSAASMSLVANTQLVTKVYVPRLIIPLAAVLPPLVDFMLASVVFVALMAWYSVVPTLAILAVPLLVLLALVTALSIGLWFAALNVQYRDVQYVIPFFIQVWFFVTPVAYSTQLIPAKYHLIYGLNPMTGVVQGFRWALLGKASSVGPLLGLSIGIVFVLLVTGLAYFRRVEKRFADLI
jgi:lipopolysaccharide transport system permease protein